MQKDENYIAHCLLFQFHLGKSVTEAHDTLCKLYGQKVVKRSFCELYFERFRIGDTVFDENMEHEVSSDEDSESYFVPSKRKCLSTTHSSLSQRMPRVSNDILTDVLKYLSRRRLSELEEVNTVLWNISQHCIPTVHTIQTVHIYQKEEFFVYLPDNREDVTEPEDVTEVIKSASLKFIRFNRLKLDQAWDDELYDPSEKSQNKGVIPERLYFSKLKPALSEATVVWKLSRLLQSGIFGLTCKYLKECASVHLNMSPFGADDSHGDVYYKNRRLITEQRRGYTAPALVSLLRANVTNLYINMVDDFNGIEINNLIDEMKKDFQKAVKEKCFVVTVEYDYCPTYFQSYEPPPEFCLYNETTGEELRLIMNNIDNLFLYGIRSGRFLSPYIREKRRREGRMVSK
ncbi:hypothetical protein Ddc_19676 [Ditylenchus destructor]|nr:hypothetical protein Ddc_19676 [Ditylenchus destructor]